MWRKAAVHKGAQYSLLWSDKFVPNTTVIMTLASNQRKPVTLLPLQMKDIYTCDDSVVSQLPNGGSGAEQQTSSSISVSCSCNLDGKKKDFGPSLETNIDYRLNIDDKPQVELLIIG